MRRVLLLIAAAVIALGNTGCLINIYSSDPNRRHARAPQHLGRHAADRI